jgi:hypothetical protein
VAVSRFFTRVGARPLFPTCSESWALTAKISDSESLASSSQRPGSFFKGTHVIPINSEALIICASIRLRLLEA